MQPGFVFANYQAPNLQWYKTYGPYTCYSVIQTSDGGYAIAGQNATEASEYHGYGDYQSHVIKTDSSGKLQWQTETPMDSYAVSIVQTKDGGYVIGCKPDGTLIKLDNEGNVQWSKTFGLLVAMLLTQMMEVTLLLEAKRAAIMEIMQC